MQMFIKYMLNYPNTLVTIILVFFTYYPWMKSIISVNKSIISVNKSIIFLRIWNVNQIVKYNSVKYHSKAFTFIHRQNRNKCCKNV